MVNRTGKEYITSVDVDEVEEAGKQKYLGVTICGDETEQRIRAAVARW